MITKHWAHTNYRRRRRRKKYNNK